MMEFKFNRRQQFLDESYYQSTRSELVSAIESFLSESNDDDDIEAGWIDSYSIASRYQFDLLILDYTAGKPIEYLRLEFDKVIELFKELSIKQRAYYKNNNFSIFDIEILDDYCVYIWIISLCYLLKRTDLLPLVANLVDGEDQENGGKDWIVEEFLAFNDDNRFDCSDVLFSNPYFELSNAFVTQDNKVSVKHLNKFLKKWYKDLSGAPWHDSHKSEGRYYGYWDFEAACAVILLEIENDKEFHEYLYYPKDLIEFYRTFKPSSAEIDLLTKYQKVSIQAGEKCPQSGYWFTVAKENTRKYFKQGEIFPDFESDWGDVYWQFDGEE
ncbi:MULTISPECIES: PoNe immunity protein domain-containing protein [unclassified Acinetobacter]|uniref:PoNe immunity protein domain-containing protein n=1 Tax=unclassified Acinetobacter TaxID=196816 RepID=UPI0015D3B792|nr:MULTISPECIES: PoNe immunity protein domain-containing protein [unclassified Acinetobacter]